MRMLVYGLLGMCFMWATYKTTLELSSQPRTDAMLVIAVALLLLILIDLGKIKKALDID